MSGEAEEGLTVALRDGNRVADVLPIIDQTIESVNLKQP